MSPQQQPGGEKTEQATPKKKREAREQGQVFKSAELITSLSMLVMFGALAVFGSGMASGIKKLMAGFFSGENLPETITIASVVPIFGNAIKQFVVILLPVLGAALLSGLVFNYLQVGFLFSAKAAAPKLSRISMAQGFKRIFSTRSLVDLVKILLKVGILAYIAYNEYQAQVKKLPSLLETSLPEAIDATVDVLVSVAFELALATAIIAPFDLLYQWWRHRRDLMMTKQEVKDEYKLTEGNPQIKSAIRAKQRQISTMRMMQALTRADVVITNPTHYAVALEYKAEQHNAPVVLAKGKDIVAKRIKERARELNIEIVENRAVAQQIYFFCDIGDEVPEELYQAVAEILAYVYRLKQKMKR